MSRKAERLYESITDIDDRFIAEAEKVGHGKRKLPLWLKISAAAACIVLCLAGAVRLYLPQGMGCSSDINVLAEADGDLYYSTWGKGVYMYNPSMNEPKKLADTGSFVETGGEVIYYSPKDGRICRAAGGELEDIGRADMSIFDKSSETELPGLIGVYEGFSYWKDNEKIIRSALSGGQSEEIFTASDAVLGECTVRENMLCYKLSPAKGNGEKLMVMNLDTGEERLLCTLPIGENGASSRVHFGEGCIIIEDRGRSSLYKLTYEGGEPEYLSSQMPITAAADFYGDRFYYETAFGENESEEFGKGEGFYSVDIVSLDTDTGEVRKIGGFSTDDGRGALRFTVTKIKMTDGGFYFADPQKGLFYHSYENGTDRHIDR